MEERFELSGKHCIKDNSMSKERYTEHTFAWELPNGDSVTKSNYNLADIETKYIPIQTGIISDNKDKTIAKLQQRIAELKEQLKNSIRPKFNRQEHIYCVAFGEIREFVVVAYLDNNITLCEDTTTGRLEWCDNNFLVLTKEEALEKLKELKGEKDD